MMRSKSIVSERPAWKRRTPILVVALSALLLVGVFAAACGGGTTATTAAPSTTVGGATTTNTPTSTGGGGGAQVVMKNLAFDPDAVTVKVGESVTWTNEDSSTHTVVADNGEFESGNLAKGDTFTFKFETAGTFTYHCNIHPSMTGTVVVE